MKKSIMMLMMFFLSSCSLMSNQFSAADGTQKIKVRVWRDHSPNILTNTVDELKLDILAEPIVEFDSMTIGDDVYIAYTTDRAVNTILTPTDANPLLPPDLAATITPENKLLFFQIRRDNSKLTTLFQRERTIAGTAVTDSVTVFSDAPCVSQGVWVRILRGKRLGSDRSSRFVWTLEMATQEPMLVSNIKVVNLNNQQIAVAAISNQNKVTIFNDKNQDGRIDFLQTDVFGGFIPNKLQFLNVWNMGDRTYIAAFKDNLLVTGFLKQNIWIETYYSQMPQGIPTSFQVQGGYQYAYAILSYDVSGISHFIVYKEDEFQNRRWLQTDTINAVKHPKINISISSNSGAPSECLLFGGADRKFNFFQLNKLQKTQLYPKGPIIVDWNERFSFSANQFQQVLYVRINGDQTLIFAALNNLNVWEPIQISTPPKVKAHPLSQIQNTFMMGKYPLILFKQQNGSIYLLEGLS
ncbi:MAG: hypothetical protein ACRCTQ_07195 [Brevinemataceae bacterium]